MQEKQTALEKEFELERLVLFSDAVFAIAITLLIIEIKFPEVAKGATAWDILLAFKPAIIQFLAFFISFLFIGLSWARHLKLCRFLKKYNMGLVKRNLVLLFFIVCFPFSASGITEHIRPGFMLPLVIYIFNIVGVTFSQYILIQYIFFKKPKLSVEGYDAEKKYLLLQSKWSAYILLFVFVLYVLLSLSFKEQPLIPIMSFYLLPIMMLILKKKMKKYKPAVSIHEAE